MKIVPDKIPTKIRKAAGTPIKTEEPPKEKDPVAIAQAAVEHFEKLRRELTDMEINFEKQFPEANAEVNAIRDFKDEVQESINAAKELVRTAGRTIGDFTYTAKFSRATWNPDKVLKICVDTDNAALMMAMAKAGFLKLGFDVNAANLFFDANQSYKDMIQTAWEDRQPLTPSVATPKL